jgi:uncharacterized protein
VDTSISAEAEHLSWDDIDTLSAQLADTVQASGQQYDALLVLQRGGAFTAMVLAYRLGFEAVRVLSASITNYQAASTARTDAATVGQLPSPEAVAGKRILIVDEVCDTGTTLQHMTQYLQDAGASDVHTAVVHYKPSRSETNIIPTYHIAQTDAWIVYPWEKYESATLEAA